MIFPFVALASFIVAAWVTIPAHHAGPPNPIQVAAAKAAANHQRFDHSIKLRGNAPCHSKRESDDKTRCA
jgi:hypothetical protein